MAIGCGSRLERSRSRSATSGGTTAAAALSRTAGSALAKRVSRSETRLEASAPGPLDRSETFPRSEAAALIAAITSLSDGAGCFSPSRAARRPRDALRIAAQGSETVLYPMREALGRMATVGEVCGVLREVWGEYRPEVRL